VTVLDLNSGVPQLTIDTSIKVYDLRVVGDIIVAIGYEKAIIWNLPGGNSPPDTRMNVEDSARTIYFGATSDDPACAASISLDFRYVVLLKYDSIFLLSHFLDVYCTSTRQNLQVEVSNLFAPRFAPGGQDIWCITNDESIAFTITDDALIPTEIADDMEGGSLGCPWRPSLGYNVTDDGRILGPGGERLLILPHIWRVQSGERVWNGKFLALLHHRLPEPVILEIEP